MKQAVVWPSGRLSLVPWLAGAWGKSLLCSWELPGAGGQEVGACWGALSSTACTRVRGKRLPERGGVVGGLLGLTV